MLCYLLYVKADTISPAYRNGVFLPYIFCHRVKLILDMKNYMLRCGTSHMMEVLASLMVLDVLYIHLCFVLLEYIVGIILSSAYCKNTFIANVDSFPFSHRKILCRNDTLACL